MSMNEAPARKILLPAALPGAARLIRRAFGPIGSGEREFWLERTDRLNRSINIQKVIIQ